MAYLLELVKHVLELFHHEEQAMNDVCFYSDSSDSSDSFEFFEFFEFFESFDSGIVYNVYSSSFFRYSYCCWDLHAYSGTFHQTYNYLQQNYDRSYFYSSFRWHYAIDMVVLSILRTILFYKYYLVPSIYEIVLVTLLYYSSNSLTLTCIEVTLTCSFVKIY